MPTYVYRREDGTTFEIQQRITEAPLETDPETGQKVTRVISGAGLIFKGEGFYLTDYARKSNGDKSGSETKSTGDSKGNGESKSSSSESSSTSESKSDTKTAA